MTTADLVGTESDELRGICGLVEEHCHISNVGTSLSSDAAAEANGPSVKRCESEGTSTFDLRQIAAAVCRAKSSLEIAKIVSNPSELSCSSEPRSLSETNEVNDGASADGRGSGQSLPEAGSKPLDSSGSLLGNATLTASTKSYSWSSSLPNGSTLETLGSDAAAAVQQPKVSCTPLTAETGTAASMGDTPAGVNVNTSKQNDKVSESINHADADALSQRTRTEPKSVLLERDIDDVSSVTSHHGIHPADGDGSHRAVGDGSSACDTSQQVSASASSSSSRASSRSLRVGDFLPSHDADLETTFSSPRVSLIARLSRPRHLDHYSLDQSHFDAFTMSSQPASTVCLMSTPATSVPGDFGARVSSSQSASHLTNGNLGRTASSRRSMVELSVSDVRPLPLTGSYRLDTTSGVADSTLCLSTGPLENTMSSSLSVFDNTDVSNPAVLSHMDRVANGGNAVNFRGRISALASAGSLADENAVMYPVRPAVHPGSTLDQTATMYQLRPTRRGDFTIISSHFNGHFPGGPGLAGTRISSRFYWS